MGGGRARSARKLYSRRSERPNVRCIAIHATLGNIGSGSRAGPGSGASRACGSESSGSRVWATARSGESFRTTASGAVCRASGSRERVCSTWKCGSSGPTARCSASESLGESASAPGGSWAGRRDQPRCSFEVQLRRHGAHLALGMLPPGMAHVLDYSNCLRERRARFCPPVRGHLWSLAQLGRIVLDRKEGLYLGLEEREVPERRAPVRSAEEVECVGHDLPRVQPYVLAGDSSRTSRNRDEVRESAGKDSRRSDASPGVRSLVWGRLTSGCGAVKCVHEHEYHQSCHR